MYVTVLNIYIYISEIVYHRNDADGKWNSLFWAFVFLGLCQKDLLHVEIHVQGEDEDVILLYTNTTLFNFFCWSAPFTNVWIID